MKKALYAVTALMGVAMVIAAPAAAQTSCAGVTSCTVGANAQVTIPAMFSLDITSGLTAGAIALTAPTTADLGAYVADNGPTFTVKANRAWQLSVHAAQAAFDYTGTESGAKSAANLSWGTTAAGAFTGLTTTAAAVTTGARSNGASTTIYFRTAYSADYSDAGNRPGQYSLPLVFTIAAQ